MRITHRYGRRRKGTTLVEVVVAGLISTLVLVGIGSVLVGTLGWFAAGNSRAYADIDAELAFRRIALELRSATAATILGGGSEIVYTVPQPGAPDQPFIPQVAPTVQRRIWRDANGNLFLADVGGPAPARPLVRRVEATDAANGNLAYPIFARPRLTEAIAVQLCVRPEAVRGQGPQQQVRLRQIVFLRNAPRS